jgi:4-diphosphocytidyl-2-C-methyl-D-erythritol kinase
VGIAGAEHDAESAPAKVNLFLHVTGRRADGYHLLDSLVVFAAAADLVTWRPSGTLTIEVTGPFAPSLAAEPDNLVLRAARMLAASGGVPARGALELAKRLPVASGIGGGSADAAAALRLLCRAWHVNPELDGIAIGLGADVSVCLRNRPMRMRGVGERLSPAPALPACGLVLVNPGVPVSTAAVFRARTGEYSAAAPLPASWRDARSMAASLAALRNDLERPAISLAPVIGDVLRAIGGTRGCLLARMSGSGATCFGLFENAHYAEAAATEVTKPGWWAWGGGLAA